MFAGNFLDADKRRPGVEWYHCVQDPAAMLRDFTKWDDQPVSLQHFAESVMRALQDRHHAADGARAHHRRRRLGRKNRSTTRKNCAFPKLTPLDPAAGRQRRGCRSGQDAGRGAKIR